MIPTPERPKSVAVERVSVSTVPPMLRTQMPPPDWLGCGLPGAETKAVDWVRKVVLTVFSVETIEPTALAPLADRNAANGIAAGGAVHCACAALDAPTIAT